jgi:hypothetical protein
MSQSPAEEYRRRARHLRWVLRGRGGQLHKSLTDLAEQQNQGGATMRLVQPPDPACQAFADLVVEHMDGDILRYSQRTALLRQASRLGIGRFEANLVIAAVQHRAARGDYATPPRQNRWLNNAVVFLLIQSIIIWTLYLLVMRN